MVYDAKRGVVEVLGGLGAAPKLATREHFTKHGGIPTKGDRGRPPCQPCSTPSSPPSIATAPRRSPKSPSRRSTCSTPAARTGTPIWRRRFAD